jgi:hypothetical protein
VQRKRPGTPSADAAAPVDDPAEETAGE